MSRCFPFPPPEYELSRAKIESLIDSVKKEKQKKKEKRREKKEKRKEREDKTNKEIVKNHISQRKREAETQPLERSSVTEEHAHPVDFPVPSSSSDSTQNSHKTKMHYTSSRDVAAHSQGKVILIRLPSNKQNELDSLAKEQHLCSISAVALENAGVKTSMQRLESLYKNLLEDCLPSWTQYAQMETEDLDWLMQRKNEDDVRTRKRQRSESSDGITFSRSSAWPRAEYLHEIGAYALPFTIPY